MRTPCILKKRATPNGATPRHFTALRFKVALQRCLYPSCGTIIVSLDGLRRQLAQFAPDRRLNMLRTGGSSHTGQAAPPHRNIHFLYTEDISNVGSGEENKEPDDWFAREYGRIDEYEDRATVFEALMIKDEVWWNYRPYLQKKAQFLLDKAEAVFGELFPGY